MPTSRSGAAGGGTTGTDDRTVTMTPAVGDHVLVFAVVTGNTQSAPTMTDDNTGGTYTLLAALPWSTSAHRMFCFVRDNLMVNTNSTIITLDTDTNDAGHFWVHQASGCVVGGAASIRQIATQSNGATGTTPAPTFASAVLTQNLTVGAVGSQDGAMTPPTNWTEQLDQGQATPTTWIEGVTRQSGFTGTTVTWGSTCDADYAAIVVEFESYANLSGTSAGVASTTATIAAYGSLSGSSDGAATVSATWTAYASISGTSAGVASPTATLFAYAAISGLAAGEATALAAISAYADVSGTSSGVASIAATLEAYANISGTSAGVASVLGNLTNADSIRDISGSAAGSSAVSGVLTALANLSGTSSGVAIVSGYLTQVGAEPRQYGNSVIILHLRNNQLRVRQPVGARLRLRAS